MSTAPITLEAARAGEAPALTQLLSEVGLPTDDLTPQHWPHFVVARRAGRIVGAAGVEALGRYGLLRSVAVAPAFQRHGLASQLVREAEAHAKAHGVEQIYLLTTTAEVFFAKRGYAVTERKAAPAELQSTSEFKSVCPESAVCMAKAL